MSMLPHNITVFYFSQLFRAQRNLMPAQDSLDGSGEKSVEKCLRSLVAIMPFDNSGQGSVKEAND